VSGAPHDHEDLRAAFQDLAENASGDGVDVEQVWRAVAGEASAEERRAVVLKVAEDPSWALAWRLAHELAAASREGARPRVLRPTWSAPFRHGALAAALLVATGVGLWLREAPAPGYRDGDTERIESLVPENVSLPRTKAVLRWRSAPGATYTVHITSEDLARVHTSSGLKESQYQIPEEFLTRVPPSAKLLWQVEARFPDGRVVTGKTFVVTLE
jgi:hypothetical protein